MIRMGISGQIAYEAAAHLMKANRKMLEERFSQRFLRAFDSLPAACPKTHSVQSSAPAFTGTAPVSADDAWADKTEYSAGGLFGTVWRALDILEKSGDLPFTVNAPAGCRIDLQQIPIRQEIIEICELFDENPYEADSSGAYLVIWDEDTPENCSSVWFHMGDPSGDILPETGNRKGYPDSSIVQIGYITNTKDRLILNGDMVRYLTPRERQMTDITRRKNDRRSTDEQQR